jgi:hypothetical protein
MSQICPDNKLTEQKVRVRSSGGRSREEIANWREKASCDCGRDPAASGCGVCGLCVHDPAGSRVAGLIWHPAPQLQAAQPQGLYLWWVGGSGVCPAGWWEGGWQWSNLTAGEACCLPNSAGRSTMGVYAKCMVNSGPALSDCLPAQHVPYVYRCAC